MPNCESRLTCGADSIMSVEKYFHDPTQFSWVQTLYDLYPQIKSEWNNCPTSLRKPMTFYKHGLNIEETQDKWYLVPLMIRDQLCTEILNFFPATMSLVDKLPVHENLSFSVFYPGAKTTKHKGWSTDIVRVHLAVDTDGRSGLHCGDQCVYLKNGEVLIFEDGEEHYAFNDSDRERVVLIFDVLKTKLFKTTNGV